MPSYQELVGHVVREAREPLTLDDVLRRVSERQRVTSSHPKQTIHNALANNPTVGSLGDGRYVDVPRALTGSSFRIPLEGVSPAGPLLPVGDEVGACLRSAGSRTGQPSRVSLQLDGVRSAAPVEAGLEGGPFSARALRLPGAFWEWLVEQQHAGADALVLRCHDGEVGEFTVEGLCLAEVDLARLAARNAQVLSVARDILHRQATYTEVFVLRLVVRGAYHGEPQPDRLPHLLFDLDGRFIADGLHVSFRPELTPALRQVLAARLEPLQRSDGPRLDRLPQSDDHTGVGDLLARLESAAAGQPEPAGAIPRPLGQPETPDAEEQDELVTEISDEEESAGPEPPAEHLYRLRVRLQWRPSVWRVIEILDTQTLAELHEAIQDAFDWDRDHLYAFFLSGKAWDGVTQVNHPPDDAEAEPPYADEVWLGDLELESRQRFLYIFDFGDDLRHDVKVLGIFPAPDDGDFPRITEIHGDAPPQYSDWGEADEEEEEAEWGLRTSCCGLALAGPLLGLNRAIEGGTGDPERLGDVGDRVRARIVEPLRHRRLFRVHPLLPSARAPPGPCRGEARFRSFADQIAFKLGERANLGNLTATDVPVLHDLCRILLEYTYTAQQLIERVENRLSQLEAKHVDA